MRELAAGRGFSATWTNTCSARAAVSFAQTSVGRLSVLSPATADRAPGGRNNQKKDRSMSSRKPNLHASMRQRTEFMRLDPAALAHVRHVKDTLDRELPTALDVFYTHLRRTPDVVKYFSDDASVERAKGAQVRHWASISHGDLGPSYVDRVVGVGRMHARIGLEPRWYIGGYALIVDHLVGALVKEMWPRGRFVSFAEHSSQAEVSATIGALLKLVFLDMDLALSVYGEASEAKLRAAQDEAKIRERVAETSRQQAHEQAQVAALASERAFVSRSFGAALARLAAKDMTFRMQESLPEAYGSLQDDFNKAVTLVHATMADVVETSHAMATGASEISAAADDLAMRTEQQAANLEEAAASLGQITDKVHHSAASAVRASTLVAEAKANAERSGAVVQDATDAMTRISQSSQQIGSIIGVIDEIAFQTNLLALNAGVEAARAGDAGRGFAVVASEVRALAQRSAEAAKEIKALISTSSGEVKQGVHLVAQAGATLSDIAAQVATIDGVVAEIARNAQEQASGLQEVSTTIVQMDQMTQQNAAMVEETNAATRNLSDLAQALIEAVGEFRIDGSVGSAIQGRAASNTVAARLKLVGGGA